MTLSDADARPRSPAAGLDAAHVEDLARRTVAEDLAGGVDVTQRRDRARPTSGVARPSCPRAAGVRRRARRSRWRCSTCVGGR